MAGCILIINGSNPITYLLKTVLKKDFKVFSVSNCFEGLLVLKRNDEINTLIVDVDFDSEENWEFINFIKTSYIYKMPVIVLTSNSSSLFWQQFNESNADFAFNKPFNPIDLIVKIHTFQSELLYK